MLSNTVPIVAPAGTSTVIVNVSTAPTAMSPTDHVGAANAPAVTVLPVIVSAASTVSSTSTSVATDGPKFSTVIV